MDQLVDFLSGVEPPSKLKVYHTRPQQALSDQRAFFAEWLSQGEQFQYRRGATLSSHPKIASSSAALKQAYDILMKTYPRESERNKEGFFDYHCALDFL